MAQEIDKKQVEEKRIRAKSGMGILILLLLLMVASVAAAVFGILFLARERFALGGVLLGAGGLFSCVIGPILFCGTQGPQAQRSAGTDIVRQILRYFDRPWFFLCESLCYCCKSGGPIGDGTVLVSLLVRI